jgi:hypothetical protein
MAPCTSVVLAIQWVGRFIKEWFDGFSQCCRLRCSHTQCSISTLNSISTLWRPLQSALHLLWVCSIFNPHSPSTNFKQHSCTVLDCGESESWCHMSEQVMWCHIIVLEQNLCGGILLVSSVIRCCELEFFAECFSLWVQLLCSLCALLPQAGEWCSLFFLWHLL